MKIVHIVSTLLSLSDTSKNSTMKSRGIERIVKATKNGPLTRLIGTVDMDGKGTEHGLSEVDPFILMDMAIIPKDNFPPFGVHPHRGHSVVTILLEGKMSSWDSVVKTKHIIEGPASYWVDAGTGVFHDERSILEDENATHPKLFQLWVGINEEDRNKPPRIQRDDSLPTFDCMDANDSTKIIGKGIYHVGDKTSIETPHPITVAHIKQQAGTSYNFPVQSDFGGFVVSMKGDAIFASKESKENDVLVLSNEQDTKADFLHIETQQESEYLICSGKKIGERWVKKLVANGAVIAANEDQARDFVPKVEGMSESGKGGGSFAPFGV